MTTIEFRVIDIYDANGVPVCFKVRVVLEQDGHVIAMGELGQSTWRQDAEKMALEAYARSSNKTAIVQLALY